MAKKELKYSLSSEGWLWRAPSHRIVPSSEIRYDICVNTYFYETGVWWDIKYIGTDGYGIAFETYSIFPFEGHPDTGFDYAAEYSMQLRFYRFITRYSVIQVNDPYLSIEHLLSLTLKRYLSLESHIDEIMKLLNESNIENLDFDTSKLSEYVGNPKYLKHLRPSLRGLCVKNIHDLKNWFYLSKKSAQLPSEIKAL